MSRSGYSDDYDYDQWQGIMWRGAVASAIRGKRGQAFLKEMLAALDALEESRLVSDVLQDPYDTAAVCALGAVGKTRGLDMEKIYPEDRETVAGAFGIPNALASEIMFLNDDGGPCKGNSGSSISASAPMGREQDCGAPCECRISI